MSDKIKNILSFVLIGFIILPFFIAIMYAMPSVDDYINAYDLAKYCNKNNISMLRGVFEYTYLIYISWQGAFVMNILLFLLLGITNVSIVCMRIVMTISLLAHYSALFLLSKIICYKVKINKLYIKNLVFVAITLFIDNIVCVDETFYWVTGIFIYTLPMTLSILTIALFLSDLAPRRTLLASICGFVASQGVLIVAGFINISIFILLVFTYITTRKISKERIYIFIGTFLGAIINAIAPGNFKRQDLIKGETSLNLYKVMSTNMKHIQYNWNLVLHNSFLIVSILILTFIILFVYKRNATVLGINPVYVWVAGFVVQFISIFPFSLGMQEYWIPDSRIKFIMAEIVAIGIIIPYLYTIIFLVNKVKILDGIKSKLIIFAILSILAMINRPILDLNNPLVACFKELRNNDLLLYETSEKAILDKIRCSDEDIVIINDEIINVVTLKEFGLERDSQALGNSSLAHFYGKKKIILGD